VRRIELGAGGLKITAPLPALRGGWATPPPSGASPRSPRGGRSGPSATTGRRSTCGRGPGWRGDGSRSPSSPRMVRS